MPMTVEEFRRIDKDLYQVIDIRGEMNVRLGAVPGAVNIPEDALADSPLLDKSKKQLLICTRGISAEEQADILKEKGYDADYLEGGYMAWLTDLMLNPPAEEPVIPEDDLRERAEKSIVKKFHKKIWSKFTHAIQEYELVQPGDRVCVCISGGKDSVLMAKCFQELQRHRKFPFEVKFLVMDPGYSRENRALIEENARRLGIPIEIHETEIFSDVFNVEKNPCYLCARMRRGHLYKFARDMGCNKIALGHHFDDVIETLLMGMLYGAQIQGMMPKLRSTNFPGMELIRPLYLVREEDIIHWRDYNGLRFLACACKFTEGSAHDESLSKRKEIKRLIADLKKVNPQVDANIFRSAENVCLDTLIAYKSKGERHSFLDTYDE